MVRLYNFMHAIRSPSRRHAQGSMQLCIRRNPNMAAHSIFSESLYGHAVLIRSCFSGFIISLLHKRRKGIAIFNIDSHVWISPYTLTSTELHAPSPASPARYAPDAIKVLYTLHFMQVVVETYCMSSAVENVLKAVLSVQTQLLYCCSLLS